MDKKRKDRKVKEKAEKRAKREVQMAEGTASNLLLPPLNEADSADASRRREERDNRIRLERAAKAASSFRVLIDCGFTDQMTPKECLSMGSQITYCYAYNRRNYDSPVHLDVSELGGAVENYLSHLAGYPQNWESLYRRSDQSLDELHNVDDLVYLTADSDNEITELDDTKVYVIGGIVDRNRLQKATLNRAADKKITTARLPIGKYLAMGSATKVLTCNHVFEILCRWKACGDWQKAMMETLPQRKDIGTKGGEGEAVEGGGGEEDEGGVGKETVESSS
jgi:tRNA (guanine9-N1)-methyltransferase